MLGGEDGGAKKPEEDDEEFVAKIMQSPLARACKELKILSQSVVDIDVHVGTQRNFINQILPIIDNLPDLIRNQQMENEEDGFVVYGSVDALRQILLDTHIILSVPDKNDVIDKIKQNLKELTAKAIISNIELSDLLSERLQHARDVNLNYDEGDDDDTKEMHEGGIRLLEELINFQEEEVKRYNKGLKEHVVKDYDDDVSQQPQGIKDLIFGYAKVEDKPEKDEEKKKPKP